MILEALSKAKWLFLVLAAPALAWFSQSNAPQSAVAPEPDSVNLALRRTADRLLRLSGDSTSTIPAVEQISEHLWRLRLEQPFSYESLPAQLDTALGLFQISTPYQVTVRSCTDSLILLGFHQADTSEPGMPCGGRESDQGCRYIELTFLPNTQPEPAGRTPWLLFLSLGISGLALYRWLSHRKRGQTHHQDSTQVKQNASASPDTPWLHFGDSRFDSTRQLLEHAGLEQKLTYREAKLLTFLAERPNQLVERDLILQQVWADEGIQVSRSVDVFISRLRKKLASDTKLRIIAVHGVGYRFEVDQ